jgi:hypothetical protein
VVDSGETGGCVASGKLFAASDRLSTGRLREPRPRTRLYSFSVPVLRSWVSSYAEDSQLPLRTGFKLKGGGPHQSKTMMLADLGVLLAAHMECRPNEAVVGDNLLGKPSVRAREAAAYQLRQLYGVGDAPPPISLALFALWRRDPPGRPLLALLCALARDPTLRDSADVVLDAQLGTQVRAPEFAAAYEIRQPGRLGANSAASLSRNAASSWMQAGHLLGAVRKTRVRAKPTPAIAAYAALLASICGFGGASLLECRWLDILDRPAEDRLALLRQAEGLGLVRVRQAGDVLEIDVRRPMAGALGVPGLVNG